MTEAEWLAGTDPEAMLEFLRGTASERKLRLFAGACCRPVWSLLANQECRNLVEVSEQFADELASLNELENAREVVEESFRNAQYTWCLGVEGGSDSFLAAARAAETGGHREAANYARHLALALNSPRQRAAAEEASAFQCHLIRDLFGNPFRPVTLDPTMLTWNGGTVPKLAQVIYDDRRFSDLPILADAFEEAGCSDQDILAHCRSEGSHVRGCWVVDLILGKS
jgi:hypothetical protein